MNKAKHVFIYSLIIILTTGCMTTRVSHSSSTSTTVAVPETKIEEVEPMETQADDEEVYDSNAEPLTNHLFSETPVISQEAIYQVQVTEDLVYGKAMSHREKNSVTFAMIDLLMDVYEPIDAPDNRPAIVIIHGGGFVGGSKDSGVFKSLASYFASRGFVAVSIDYRLDEDNGTNPTNWISAIENDASLRNNNVQYALYPAVRDAKTAIRYLYAKAGDYGINTDFITVAGSSAGAYTSIAAGVTENGDFKDELTIEEDPSLEYNHRAYDSTVHTIVDLWGGYGIVTMLDMIEDKTSISTDTPPILIIHGESDMVVPITEAENIVNIYDQVGVDYTYYPLEGQGHSAWDAVIDGQSIEEVMFDFIVESQKLEQ